MKTIKIPFDRVVTFILPYVSVVAGLLSTWLLTNIHVLGLFNLNHDQVAQTISQLVVFALTAGAAELGRSQWLKGRHIELEGLSYQVSSPTGLESPSSDEDDDDVSDEVDPEASEVPDDPDA